MKPHLLKLIALGIFCLGATSANLPAAIVTKEYGSGSDTTHLLLQFAGTVDSVLYTYHFTYNADTALTGAALFLALDAADTNLSLTYSGSPSADFFLSDISYNGYSEPTSAQASEGSYWNSFLAGGLEQALDENYAPIPGAYNAVPKGTWNTASVGASLRIVQPGSWDAWVLGPWVEETDGNGDGTGIYSYAGAQPSVSPVPEPATWALLIIGGVALVWRSNRRHA